MILEISNATRYIELRRDFFAHLIVTVSPGDRLESVELLKDGRSCAASTPGMGESRSPGRCRSPAWTASTGPAGPGPSGSAHFQADWPVEETGWYGLRAATAGGGPSPPTRSSSTRRRGQPGALRGPLDGPGTRWAHWGYGEEMPLAEIRSPFEGDHWWYPNRTVLACRGRIRRRRREIVAGETLGTEGLFRTPAR